MNNYKTVSVGISAYNEQANIKNLLLSLLEQDLTGYILCEIIIITDKSVDKTVLEIKKLKEKRIKLIIGKKRLGKAKRLNQLFKLFRGNVFVQLDADIVITDKFLLKKIINSFNNDKKLSVIFGRHIALNPKTFCEKLAYFGFQVWNNSRENVKDNSRHYCTGHIMSFSRSFIKVFKFPKNIGSIEDSYCFYYTKINNYNSLCLKSATVYFRLASSFKDYINQMSRFLGHRKEMANFFSIEQINRYETIKVTDKLKSLFKIGFKTPKHIIIGFIILQLITKINLFFYKDKDIWDIAESTKLVNIT